MSKLTKEKIQELKKLHGKNLTKITVANKDIVLRQPTLSEYSIMRQACANENYINGVLLLARQITVWGAELLDENEGRLFLNIVKDIVESIDIVNGDIEQVGNHYIYTTKDGKKAKFRQMNRAEFSEWQTSNETNSVRAGVSLGEKLFVSGDKSIVTENRYLFGVYDLFSLMIVPIKTSVGKL